MRDEVEDVNIALRTSELLTLIASTDYACPALIQQKRFMADLENLVSEYNYEIERVDDALERSRRAISRNSGSLSSDGRKHLDDCSRDERVASASPLSRSDGNRNGGGDGSGVTMTSSKTQEEQFDTVYDHFQAKAVRATLLDMYCDAQVYLPWLGPKVEAHARHLRELDSLFSPQCPDSTTARKDDEHRKHETEEKEKGKAKEATTSPSTSNLRTARENYEKFQSQSTSTIISIATLTKARARLRDALKAIDRSLAMEFYAPNMVDAAATSANNNTTRRVIVVERSELTRADLLCTEARILISLAQRMSPSPPPMTTTRPKSTTNPVYTPRRLEVRLREVLRSYFCGTGSPAEWYDDIVQSKEAVTAYLGLLRDEEPVFKTRLEVSRVIVADAHRELEKVRLVSLMARVGVPGDIGDEVT